MTKRVLALLSVSLILLSAAFGQQPSRFAALRGLIKVRGPMNEIIPGLLRVKLSQHHAASLAKNPFAIAEEAIVPQGTFIRQLRNTGWTLWSVPAGTDTKALAATVKQNPQVACAEPVNRVYPLLLPPNDGDYLAIEDDPNLVSDPGSEFRRLWHLDDTNAEFAWTTYPNTWFTAATKPLNSPLVAIVDTGADMNHPDFINAGGFSGSTINGGQWDMSRSAQFQLGEIDPTGTPEDANGHGTHVAGLLLAAGNNGTFNTHGVIGIGYNSTGMMLRVFNDVGIASDTDAAVAIMYAADQGADIINCSIGTGNFSQVFQDAVTYAYQKGSLVVCAGNENGNGGGDLGPIYPAACSGALGVSPNGPGGAPASDYGGTGYYVDIAAPGGDVEIAPDFSSFAIQFVFSTMMRTPGALFDPSGSPPIGLDYAYLAGTSMACPQVSGAAALYYGLNNMHQQDGYQNVRAYRALELSAVGLFGAPGGGWETTQGYGVLDADALLFDDDARGSTIGSIEGIVYFNTTPIANVSVKAKKTDGTGATFSTTTEADGTYRFDGMPPGVYKLTTAPFGAVKVKNQLVKAGSDTTGTDFWCGTFFFDDTPPTIAHLDVSNVTPTSIDVHHWGYDTETGIDLIKWRIGTTPGGVDVMPDTEINPDGNKATIVGLTIPAGHLYFLQGTYTNGAGLTSTVTTMFGSGTLAVNPTSSSFLFGQSQTGSLSDLFLSDNLYRGAINDPTRGRSDPAVELEVDGTLPIFPITQLQFTCEAQCSMGPINAVPQKILAFNFQTSAWDVVDTRSATTTDSVATITLNTAKYVDPVTHQVKARMAWFPSGLQISRVLGSKIDQAVWKETP